MSKQENKTMGKQENNTPSWRALLGVNFFIETNRMEPFVAVYFITYKGWEKVSIGYISLVMNMIMLVLQTPAGDLLDKTHRKKGIICAATLVAAVTTTAVVWTSNFWAVMFLKTLEGVATTIFLPGLMSLLLGVIPTQNVPKVVADCEVSNKLGSVLFCLGCGLISYYLYPNVSGVFYLLGAGGVAAAIFVLTIPDASIDHDRSRSLAIDTKKEGGDDDHHDKDEENAESEEDEKEEYEQETDEQEKEEVAKQSMTYRELLSDRNIRVFAIVTFVYHLANAGVVPLVAQFVAIGNEREALAFTSATLLIFYFVQAPTAFLVGKYVDKMNYKNMLLLAHLVLPIRCAILALLVVFWDNKYAITATQIFDGIGAGVYDTMIPIVVTKLTTGSGRFGFTFGFIVTCWRVGHGFSYLLAEAIASAASYEVAFISLGSIGIVSCVLLLFGVQVPKDEVLSTKGDIMVDREARGETEQGKP